MKTSLMASLIVGVILLGGVLLFVVTGNDENESSTLNQTQQAEAPQSTNQLDETPEQPESIEAEFTAQEVALHNSSNDCWTIIEGSVYDITTYINRHPGGNAIELACGTNGTSLFTQRTTSEGEQIGSGTPHSTSAERQLSSFFIGTLVN